MAFDSWTSSESVDIATQVEYPALSNLAYFPAEEQVITAFLEQIGFVC